MASIFKRVIELSN